MIRGLLAVVTAALVVIATAGGFVIVNQDWGLAATALVGFGVVVALSTCGIFAALFLSRHRGAAEGVARAPAMHA